MARVVPCPHIANRATVSPHCPALCSSIAPTWNPTPSTLSPFASALRPAATLPRLSANSQIRARVLPRPQPARRRELVVRAAGQEGGEKDDDKPKAAGTLPDGDSGSKAPESSSPPPPPSAGPPSSPAPVQLDSYAVVALLGPEKVDADDVALLRAKLFGYSTFFVTGQEPFGEAGEAVLLQGNLRGPKEEVFAKLRAGMRQLFGAKYELLMVQEPRKPGAPPSEGEGKEERVAMVVVRAEQLQGRATSAWQFALGALLLALTGGACLELGLASQISKVSPDVIRYFTSPNPEELTPPDVTVLAPLVRNALPIAYGVFGVQVFHEVAHWLTAAQKRVRLGIPYLIPNITIGSFGAITQIKSPCPDRTALFDIAMAGPLAGATLSLAMFAAGLALSLPPAGPLAALPGLQESLVQVPSQLFQGSLLLGALCRAVLGYDLMHVQAITIHPLVIVGWYVPLLGRFFSHSIAIPLGCPTLLSICAFQNLAQPVVHPPAPLPHHASAHYPSTTLPFPCCHRCGLTTSALNLLPAGRIDGGRATQAAFGRDTVGITSLVTYGLLGIGLLGGPFSLPFGLYVLFLQRDFEKPALNDVTGVGWQRQLVLAGAIALAVGTLLPIWDGLADDLGIGIGSQLF
ncbi:unnamed protein product [Closterium sp. NIES-54]